MRGYRGEDEHAPAEGNIEGVVGVADGVDLQRQTNEVGHKIAKAHGQHEHASGVDGKAEEVD